MIDFARLNHISKISKLIGMLGAEHDGEMLNAARLLKQQMEAAGLTYGELAEMIRGNGPRERVVYVYVNNPGPRDSWAERKFNQGPFRRGPRDGRGQRHKPSGKYDEEFFKQQCDELGI